MTEWTGLTFWFRIIILILAQIGMVYVLYLNWKMIKFTKQYSKKWSMAFKVLGIAMCVIVLRRGIGLLWATSNIDFLYAWDHTHTIFEWIDYVGVAVICTICYIVFFHLEWKWWGAFWTKYSIEELPVQQVVVEEANHVEVIDPKKVEVDLKGKVVTVEKPVKVLVEKPQKVEVTKARGKK